MKGRQGKVVVEEEGGGQARLGLMATSRCTPEGAHRHRTGPTQMGTRLFDQPPQMRKSNVFVLVFLFWGGVAGTGGEESKEGGPGGETVWGRVWVRLEPRSADGA